MNSWEKEDDDDFTPNPNYRSNLASIFGNSDTDGNPSLTYTAPKQPKSQKPTKVLSNSTSKPSTVPSSSSSCVIIAKTVQTFKMVDGAYQNQGRLGAVVISTEGGSVYQLLLYRDKRNHFCNARITRYFKFHIQPKNYCTFYDKQSVIWSILFDSDQEVAEFALQVAVARWKAEDSPSPIMVQDLRCPVSDDTKAAVGDTVDLSYALLSISNASEQPGAEESQNISVEVEASGWKQELVGAQSTTRRVIILQPFMLGDLNPNEVVYNSPVVVKLTVSQVHKAASASPPESTLPPSLDLKKLDTIDGSTNVKLAAAESLNGSPRKSPKPTKADLITRMARMGQALPFKTAAPTPSDSDDTEEDHSSRLRSAVPKPRTRVQHSATSAVGAGEIAPFAPPAPVIQQQLPAQWATAPYMVSSMYPAPPLQSPGESHFNMFLSEVRTTNSELRMGITRLTDKVEALQNMIENSDKRPNYETNPVVERLLENELQLKNQLQLVLTAIQNSQPLSQNRAVGDTPALAVTSDSAQACQRCLQLDQSNASLSENMKQLQEKNDYLEISLTAQKDALQNAKFADQDQLDRIETLQKQLQEEQSKVSDLNHRLLNLQSEKESSEQKLAAAKTSITQLQNTVLEQQTTIDNIEKALKDSEAIKIEEVKRNLKDVLDPKPCVQEHVKKIMNAVYRMVKVQFEPQCQYEVTFIISVLAETLKAVTQEYLENVLSKDEHQQALYERKSSARLRTSDSDETKTRLVGGQEDREVSVEVETKVTAEVDLSTPQTSAASLYADSVCTQDSENTAVVDDTHTDQQKPNPEELNVIIQRDMAQSSAADISSNEVLHSKPPPPPLFDEEENDDDWLNS